MIVEVVKDFFRPRTEPARSLYDAFQEEAKKRKGRSFEEWNRAEINAVWYAARDYAQQHGLRIPYLDEVVSEERSACGHIDYGMKWAYGVAAAMRQPEHGKAEKRAKFQLR
jgi:hypothetical protein